MPKDAVDFHVKAMIFRGMILKLSTIRQFRSLREFEIQIQKLDRMAVEFHKKFDNAAVLSMPAATLRRKKGQEMRRLSQQSKEVDKLMTKLWEEVFYQKMPAHRRKQFVPRVVQQIVQSNNKVAYETAREMRLAIASAVKQDIKELTGNT